MGFSEPHRPVHHHQQRPRPRCTRQDRRHCKRPRPQAGRKGPAAPPWRGPGRLLLVQPWKSASYRHRVRDRLAVPVACRLGGVRGRRDVRVEERPRPEAPRGVAEPHATIALATLGGVLRSTSPDRSHQGAVLARRPQRRMIAVPIMVVMMLLADDPRSWGRSSSQAAEGAGWLATFDGGAAVARREAFGARSGMPTALSSRAASSLPPPRRARSPERRQLGWWLAKPALAATLQLTSRGTRFDSEGLTSDGLAALGRGALLTSGARNWADFVGRKKDLSARPRNTTEGMEQPAAKRLSIPKAGDVEVLIAGSGRILAASFPWLQKRGPFRGVQAREREIPDLRRRATCFRDCRSRDFRHWPAHARYRFRSGGHHDDRPACSADSANLRGRTRQRRPDAGSMARI